MNCDLDGDAGTMTDSLPLPPAATDARASESSTTFPPAPSPATALAARKLAMMECCEAAAARCAKLWAGPGVRRSRPEVPGAPKWPLLPRVLTLPGAPRNEAAEPDGNVPDCAAERRPAPPPPPPSAADEEEDAAAPDRGFMTMLISGTIAPKTLLPTATGRLPPPPRSLFLPAAPSAPPLPKLAGGGLAVPPLPSLSRFECRFRLEPRLTLPLPKLEPPAPRAGIRPEPFRSSSPEPQEPAWLFISSRDLFVCC